MISIYLTNLEKYNEGYLIGEWVKLPVSDEDFNTLLKRIGIDGLIYEEWFITDVDTDISNVYDAIGEYSDISELNELAEMLELIPDYEKDKLNAVLEFENTGSIEGIKEVFANLDNFMLLTDVNNYEDLGRYYADELCCIEIPENIEYYFDYERYGRDINLDSIGEFTKFGYIIDYR